MTHDSKIEWDINVKCPKCGKNLTMHNYHGIYCRHCNHGRRLCPNCGHQIPYSRFIPAQCNNCGWIEFEVEI